jgi:hypothetical protein
MWSARRTSAASTSALSSPPNCDSVSGSGRIVRWRRPVHSGSSSRSRSRRTIGSSISVHVVTALILAGAAAQVEGFSRPRSGPRGRPASSRSPWPRRRRRVARRPRGNARPCCLRLTSIRPGAEIFPAMRATAGHAFPRSACRRSQSWQSTSRRWPRRSAGSSPFRSHRSWRSQRSQSAIAIVRPRRSRLLLARELSGEGSRSLAAAWLMRPPRGGLLLVVGERRCH